MSIDEAYSVEICNQLKEKFQEAGLHRPMAVGHYDAGQHLTYDVTGVAHADKARVHMEIQKFVGGGFAGQVYRVKITDIEAENNSIEGLEINGLYAMKILIPPSGFSNLFRNVMYRIGFQGPFQLQVNPTASRAGALWQKLLRRGAKIRFGDEKVVNDIHATFVDSTLGSCGELSDWVDGRTWRLEVDDRLDLLKLYHKGKDIDPETLGSPEYRSKKKFMADFVQLLHDMGAHEFARQYEWSTCKSQPNCLKRTDTEDDPEKGLTAVDFRAGLALLPFLPMSPGDVMLIFKGLARGSLVQFDRGNLKKLEQFIDQYSSEFEDLRPMLEELKACEEVYRNSVPDITHNHFRLLYSKKLWSTMLKSTRTGWRVRNTIDKKAETTFSKSIFKTFLFYFLGIIPILGSFFRKIWGRADMRKHYGKMVTSWNYLRRAFRGKAAEKAMIWHRDGRIDGKKALKLGASPGRVILQIPLSLLPIGLYRFVTQWSYLKERLYFLAVRPVKLYFSGEMREEWLRDMVAQGQKKRILNDEDAKVIQSQIKEPYIQKYLKSLAVHVCTLPITQVVSVLVSWIYVQMHPELSTIEAAKAVGAILVLFQITPISPGSLVRGLYVVYLAIKERNFKDYNIAVFLGFFKYIGYLAFPIQMTYRYPELARFMAGHWATEAVHIVPVFGEGGALLEHFVFNLFYNWPLTIRKRMAKIAEAREKLKARYWHVPLYIIGAAGLMTLADRLYMNYSGIIPVMKNTWWISIIICLFASAGITKGCGGASRAKRFIATSLWGVLTGILYTIGSYYFIFQPPFILRDILAESAWRIFIFAVIGTIWAVITELRKPAPDLKK